MTPELTIKHYESIDLLESEILENEPDLGILDTSECMKRWTEYFCNEYRKGGECCLKQIAVGAIVHTMIASRARCIRLIKGRDEALEALNKSKLKSNYKYEH